MFTGVWDFIFAWYNLPFTFLLGLCVLLAGLQLAGLGGDHDGDTDLDAEADADIDTDVDMDADADLDGDADFDHDLDHDLDHDADHHVDHDAHSGAGDGWSVLAFIGLGKAPLMVVLLILFGAIGILGWAANSVVRSVFGAYPGIAFAAVLPLSLIGGGLVSSRTARFIGRALPPISTTATRAQALVGKRGTVISACIDGRFGQVHVRDAAGTLISVFAVTDADEPIPRGNQVVLIDYDVVKKQYLAVRA